MPLSTLFPARDSISEAVPPVAAGEPKTVKKSLRNAPIVGV